MLFREMSSAVSEAKGAYPEHLFELRGQRFQLLLMCQAARLDHHLTVSIHCRPEKGTQLDAAGVLAEIIAAVPVEVDMSKGARVVQAQRRKLQAGCKAD